MHPLLLRLVIAVGCVSVTVLGGAIIGPHEAHADGLLGNLTPTAPTAETAPAPAPVAELVESATQVLDAVEPVPAAQTAPPLPASPPPPAQTSSSAAPAPFTGAPPASAGPGPSSAAPPPAASPSAASEPLAPSAPTSEPATPLTGSVQPVSVLPPAPLTGQVLTTAAETISQTVASGSTLEPGISDPLPAATDAALTSETLPASPQETLSAAPDGTLVEAAGSLAMSTLSPAMEPALPPGDAPSLVFLPTAITETSSSSIAIIHGHAGPAMDLSEPEQQRIAALPIPVLDKLPLPVQHPIQPSAGLTAGIFDTLLEPTLHLVTMTNTPVEPVVEALAPLLAASTQVLDPVMAIVQPAIEPAVAFIAPPLEALTVLTGAAAATVIHPLLIQLTPLLDVTADLTEPLLVIPTPLEDVTTPLLAAAVSQTATSLVSSTLSATNLTGGVGMDGGPEGQSTSVASPATASPARPPGQTSPPDFYGEGSMGTGRAPGTALSQLPVMAHFSSLAPASEQYPGVDASAGGGRSGLPDRSTVTLPRRDLTEAHAHDASTAGTDSSLRDLVGLESNTIVAVSGAAIAAVLSSLFVVLVAYVYAGRTNLEGRTLYSLTYLPVYPPS